MKLNNTPHFKEDATASMQIRLHRGGFAESMNTVAVIPKTKAAVMDFINKDLRGWGFTVTSDTDISIQFYAKDERNGWDTFIIAIQGFGVWGFLDNRKID